MQINTFLDITGLDLERVKGIISLIPYYLCRAKTKPRECVMSVQPTSLCTKATQLSATFCTIWLRQASQ